MFAPSRLAKTDPGGARPVPDCLGAFNDGRAAAWGGVGLGTCSYCDPSLATAWAAGWRAGRVEMRQAGPALNRGSSRRVW